MSTQVQRSVDDCQSLGVVIVEAVADARDVDVTEVTPLYSVIDVDALTSLFENTAGTERSTGHVTFTLDGCEITVASDGSVEVGSVEADD